jgi:DNA invertase Pin-like site-specific DNA recombinase
MSKRTVPGNPRVAVAYLRASKDEQRLSPEAQRAAVAAWAAREGVSVAAWHVDQGVRSVTPIEQRPALCAALVRLREHGAGVLVVAKRDRVARDVVLAAGVERAAESAGARLVSAAGEGSGDTPADGFMRTVIDGAAAYERALIRSRTKAALAAKRARGERAGNLPFGFALAPDGSDRLVPDASEQDVLALVRDLRRQGLTVRAIAQELSGRGIVSARTGNAYGKSQVHAILAAAKPKPAHARAV